MRNLIDIEKSLISLIADALECDANTISHKCGLGKHYNWDSLSHIVIMVAVEEKFGVVIDETNIAKLLTVQDLMDFIVFNDTLANGNQ